jgi:hypothetical protein
MSIYKFPISGGQFVNQPPKRGAGERRLVSTLAQQHQSTKVSTYMFFKTGEYNSFKLPG